MEMFGGKICILVGKLAYFFGNSGDNFVISSQNVDQVKQLEHFV